MLAKSWIANSDGGRKKIRISVVCVLMSLELCTHLCRLLTLLEKYAAQGLCNGPVSVRPSVRLSACLSHRSKAAAACGGFAAERPAGVTYWLSIDSCRRRRSAANAGSASLGADQRDSTQTCEKYKLQSINWTPMSWVFHYSLLYFVFLSIFTRTGFMLPFRTERVHRKSLRSLYDASAYAVKRS